MLKLYVNDILDLASTHLIGVTTNLGWKKNGENVMGAGIAKHVATMYPTIPKIYGEWCRLRKEGDSHICFLSPDGTGQPMFVMFPTKELNSETPWMSWKSDSTLAQIERSAFDLADALKQLKNQSLVLKRVALPPPGCGNGNLKWGDVEPILAKHLSDSPVDIVFRNK